MRHLSRKPKKNVLTTRNPSDQCGNHCVFDFCCLCVLLFLLAVLFFCVLCFGFLVLLRIISGEGVGFRV